MIFSELMLRIGVFLLVTLTFSLALYQLYVSNFETYEINVTFLIVLSHWSLISN